MVAHRSLHQQDSNSVCLQTRAVVCTDNKRYILPIWLSASTIFRVNLNLTTLYADKKKTNLHVFGWIFCLFPGLFPCLHCSCWICYIIFLNLSTDCTCWTGSQVRYSPPDTSDVTPTHNQTYACVAVSTCQDQVILQRSFDVQHIHHKVSVQFS